MIKHLLVVTALTAVAVTYLAAFAAGRVPTGHHTPFRDGDHGYVRLWKRTQ